MCCHLEIVSTLCCWFFFVFFKQKTAYEIKECDWSSDVCSSDLFRALPHVFDHQKVEEPPSIDRSEEHTSELQSHSFISYAVFCLKKKKQYIKTSLVRAPYGLSLHSPLHTTC